MCDCYTKTKDSLLDSYKKKFPEATSHEVDLISYGLAITKDMGVLVVPMIAYKGSALHTHKNGTIKRKNVSGSIAATFCPFCGERYAADNSPAKQPGAEGVR